MKISEADFYAHILRHASNKPEWSPDLTFVQDLGIDSLGLIEMTMDLEEQYGCELPAFPISNYRTVGAVLDYLKEQYNEPTP